MAEGAPMNGGKGIYSYANNSHFQREGFNAAKNLIMDILIQNLDVKSLVSSTMSKTFTIADLGCSIGPNTFLAMENIIDGVEHKYRVEGLDPNNLEFQVFFNDQVANDFNTLFASLPVDRRYHVAGVPGSFYGRLFPRASICLAYSSSSIHWLSKVPKELVDKNSPAWNKGKIHYTGARNEVVGAYAAQFDEDMDVFLNARGEEIVKGGMIVIIMPGVPDGGTVTHDVGVAFSFLESILIDMVKEGLIDQDEVDSFNIPHVYPSVKQMSRIVEKNGCFSIVNMKLRNARIDPKAPLDLELGVMHMRALAEGTFKNHFSGDTVEEIFRRAIQLKSKFGHMLDSSGIEVGAQLFAVLMRK
ncbi:loganic acid O-methyltransferase-like [Primulina eburnea]|uniref:loganic acid O-methyltransferase-like n=1 Tax=Primulina eburnea TaxID=1245227 RepID=UPI003C6C3906